MNKQPITSASEMLARIMHHGQTDLQGRDYYDAHIRPIADAARLMGLPYMVLANLHDLVEDSFLTVEQVGAYFPEEIALGLDAVSRRNGEPYMAYVSRAKAMPLSAGVKFIDNTWNRMNNARLPDTVMAQTLMTQRYDPTYRILLPIVEATFPGIESEIVEVLQGHLERLNPGA